MRLRPLVLTLLLVASATLPGCAGSDGGSTPEAATTGDTTTRASTGTTTEPTTDTTEQSPTETPPARLVIRAQGVETLTVPLWNTSLPDGEPVYNRTFEQPDGAHFLDHVFEREVGYYAVVRANGTVVVNRTLHASRGYRVEVTPNGTEVATVVS